METILSTRPLIKTTAVLFILLLFPVLAMTNNLAEPEISRKHLDFPTCPDTPNCVSSLADDPGKRVDPLPLKGNPARSMEVLAGIIYSMPRSTVRSVSDHRIEAEFRSLLGFVDDVLFVFNPEEEFIHVRSASRKGSWDLGVNRRRVERIRDHYFGRKVKPFDGATERSGD